MCRSEEKPAPTSSIASRMPRCAQRSEHRHRARRSRRPGRARTARAAPGRAAAGRAAARALGRQQGGGRDVHRDVAGDHGRGAGGALEREQLQLVAQADAVRLREADVRRLPPLGREPAQRLGADPLAGGQLDDRLQHDERSARGDHGRESVARSPPGGRARGPGLDDHRRGVSEHLHQRLVPLGQLLVRGESRGAERAVERAVAEHDRHRDDSCGSAASARPGSLIAAGKALTSGMTAGSFPSRIAWQSVVSCRWVTPSLNSNGTDDSTTSRCWVVPSSRVRNATDRWSCLGGAQQLGDLLVGLGASSRHDDFVDRSGR